MELFIESYASSLGLRIPPKYKLLAPFKGASSNHPLCGWYLIYHAFKLRERMGLSKGGRSLLQGRGEALNTLETEGQMLQRVIPDLMGMKNIMVFNDEAHHCYREKPDHDAEVDLKGDDKKEAEKNNEAARLWISGIEVVNRKLGVIRVIDLSATPFFLRGSGYGGYLVPVDDE